MGLSDDLETKSLHPFDFRGKRGEGTIPSIALVEENNVRSGLLHAEKGK